jgi:uncharacterized coiled-coil protein SlyX
MKIQRFKQFINENEEYLDEPANEMFNEILNQIAQHIDGRSGWMATVNESSSSLRIDQDWNIDDLNYEGDEPRVYASYSATFKVAFQDDASQLSPELVRLWKLGLAPITELIKGFDHVWSFSVDSKDVPELDVQDGTNDFEFMSIEDLTGGTLNDLADIESFGDELIETLNGWLDEQTYMLHDRIQEELDMISGEMDDRYGSDDEEEEDNEEDSLEDED